MLLLSTISLLLDLFVLLVETREHLEQRRYDLCEDVANYFLVVLDWPGPSWPHANLRQPSRTRELPCILQLIAGLIEIALEVIAAIYTNLGKLNELCNQFLNCLEFG